MSKTQYPNRDFEQACREYSRQNPGIIDLSIAENVLLFPEINEILEKAGDLGGDDIFYGPNTGTIEIRRRIASFLNVSLGLVLPLTGNVLMP